MRTLARGVLLIIVMLVVLSVLLWAADTGGWVRFSAGLSVVVCFLLALSLLQTSPHDTPDHEGLVVWALVDYFDGRRLVGAIEHRPEGWFACTPVGRHTVVSRESMVARIVPCDEQVAVDWAARSFVDRAS